MPDKLSLFGASKAHYVQPQNNEQQQPPVKKIYDNPGWFAEAVGSQAAAFRQ